MEPAVYQGASKKNLDQFMTTHLALAGAKVSGIGEAEATGRIYWHEPGGDRIFPSNSFHGGQRDVRFSCLELLILCFRPEEDLACRLGADSRYDQ